MKFVTIIPARFSSTRFPGKPLALLGGKPVIQHVYEKVSSVMEAVYVATDDQRIYDVVTGFGGKVVMTSANHKSGTDRIAEAWRKIGSEADVVINVQGDEPFVHPAQITSLCSCFEDSSTEIATLGKPFSSIEEVENPNSPKIVVDRRGFAMYFSRSVIPFVRGKERENWLDAYPFLKHLGIYAYRSNILEQLTQLPQSPLEITESLEQLRWLENGYRIRVGITQIETVGIDTPEDLLRAENFLKS